MLVQRGKKEEVITDFKEVLDKPDESIITEFNKVSVERLREGIENKLKGFYGLDIRLGRIVYTPKSVKAKFEINIPVDEAYADILNPGLTNEKLQAGLGTYGTPVLHSDKEAVIIKARRKKYLFKYVDSPTTEWIAPFRAFTLRTMENKVANKSF